METLNVRAKNVKPIILRALKVNRPIFIWGAPGIGKSELVQGIVDEGELGNALMIDMRLALLEPTDLRGYPFRNPETNTMEWSPPSDLPSQDLADSYDNVVLFLDELNSAPPSVQAAAYQLVLNRRIGQYNLPDNVKIIAAGNRETDRGVTYRMPAPLANRFRHVNMEVNFEDWSQWAMNNNVHPDVVGYLSFSKGDLFDFDPKSSSQSFATPRSWTFVSEMIGADGFESADAFEQKAEIAGAIGEGMAIKFMNHKKNASKLPKPSEILSGKVKELKKLEISSKYALTVGMSYELKGIQDQGDEKELTASFNNFINFLMDNFEPEMCVLGCKIALSEYDIDVDFADIDRIDEWVNRYGKYMNIN